MTGNTVEVEWNHAAFRKLEITIEYADGTTLILDTDVAQYAVKAWR